MIFVLKGPKVFIEEFEICRSKPKTYAGFRILYYVVIAVADLAMNVYLNSTHLKFLVRLT